MLALLVKRDSRAPSGVSKHSYSVLGLSPWAARRNPGFTHQGTRPQGGWRIPSPPPHRATEQGADLIRTFIQRLGRSGATCLRSRVGGAGPRGPRLHISVDVSRQPAKGESNPGRGRCTHAPLAPIASLLNARAADAHAHTNAGLRLFAPYPWTRRPPWPLVVVFGLFGLAMQGTRYLMNLQCPVLAKAGPGASTGGRLVFSDLPGRAAERAPSTSGRFASSC